jgi:hypothetical protein
VAGALLLAVAAPTAAAAPAVGTFQMRASSPKPVNNVVVDPTTNLIYTQQYKGTGFYRYNPRTNKWTTLTPAPISQGNNGGAAYLKGKIYTLYSENDTQMGVYDIATNTWTMTTNPEGTGTADITAVGHLLYVVDDKNFVSYNPTTNTTHTLSAPPFDFTDWGGLAPYKGKIYGQQGDGDTPAAFAVYDIATNKWKRLKNGPNAMVLGAAIDPVTGTFYAYGSYEGYEWYSYNIATGKWLRSLLFPHHNLNDGGMAYVSTMGLQGIYATFGQNNRGFTRYVTPPRHH